MNFKSILLVPFLVFSLLSCGEDPKTFDTDFDGLYDPIDPNPSSNLYNCKFCSIQTGKESGEVQFVMDYRDFLFNKNPSFNSNVAQIGSMLTLDTYQMFEKTVIINDTYTNEDSDVFPLYGQFGLTNAEYHSTSREDSYDNCAVYLGNHKIYNGGKKAQVFVATVRGYETLNAWTSNLDFGANTEEYFDVFGQNDEWINRKNHKGFDVSARRLYPIIKDYINRFKDPNLETYFYCFGQSRGAALTNILGTLFKDNDSNIKSAFYCFNPPRTVEESDATALEKYNNILNVICDEDLISEVPLKNWGFSFYGINYHFSHKDHIEYFESISGETFDYMSPNLINSILSCLSGIAPSRDALFSFRKPNILIPEMFGPFNNLEEANSKKYEIEHFTDDYISKNSIKAEAKTNLLSSIYVQYYTRPCIIIGLIDAILEETPTILSVDIEFIKNKFEQYKTYLSRYVVDLLPLVQTLDEESIDVETLFMKFYLPHAPLSTAIDSKFAK